MSATIRRSRGGDRMRPCGFAASACFAAALLAGCGTSDRPELGEVTGTVTNKGIPLVNGWVEFEPEKGRLSAARTDGDGRYTLAYTSDAAGAVVGRHKVKIGSGGDPATAHTMASRDDPNRVRKQIFEKSGVEVRSGDNELNFEVTEGNEYQPPAGGQRH